MNCNLPVISANACAPPTAVSNSMHSLLVEESIHTGESKTENAFASCECRNPFDDLRPSSKFSAPRRQYTLPCCYRILSVIFISKYYK